jgi:hypothetical protein
MSDLKQRKVGSNNAWVNDYGDETIYALPAGAMQTLHIGDGGASLADLLACCLDYAEKIDAGDDVTAGIRSALEGCDG